MVCPGQTNGRKRYAMEWHRHLILYALNQRQYPYSFGVTDRTEALHGVAHAMGWRWLAGRGTATTLWSSAPGIMGSLAPAIWRVPVFRSRWWSGARCGGAAVTEEFHPGFENSVCSYVVSLGPRQGRHGRDHPSRGQDGREPGRGDPGVRTGPRDDPGSRRRQAA